MPIVINGSGSITGVSTGGLPDGCVDADTLAGNAVTSAKILDGTIANGDVNDLAASKLTGALPAIDGSSLTNLPAGGKVLQVVNYLHNSSGTSSTSTTTWADTGLTATITPSSASSKILVFVAHGGCGKQSGNSRLMLQLLRGSTVVSDIENICAYDNASGDNAVGTVSCNYLDSPNTTSAVTYKTQLKTYSTGTVFVGWGSCDAYITLMEVSA